MTRPRSVPPKVTRSQRRPGLQTDTRCVEYLPCDEVVPDPLNPRKHDKAQVAAIARSIEAFGFNAPILVGRSGKVLCGHGRLDAAKLLKLPRVPVIRLEHLSEAQARAYMIADNRLTDRSSFDEAELAKRFEELSAMVLEFDIEATGFELPAIDIQLQSLDPIERADAADTFEHGAGPAVSQVGDLWHLGPHRLLCGDAFDRQAIEALLDGERVGGVFTDPPYNVPINGHAGGKGSTKPREFAMAAGEMSAAEFTAFLGEALTIIARHLAPDALVYACMDWRHLDEMSAAGQCAGLDLLNLCVWVKSNGGMGSLYRSQHELIFVFRHRRAKHRNNVQLGRFGRNRTNVWHYPGANSFPRKGGTTGLAFHPTSKPIAMVADAILDATKRDDIIFDPFAGAGTSILAAERTGRRGYGIEIDPLYVDTAIRRWQAMTDRSALHVSGLSFAEAQKLRQAST